MTALAGLFLSGYDVFTGIAPGTMAVVGAAATVAAWGFPRESPAPS
jgi:hypothetical protein